MDSNPVPPKPPRSMPPAPPRQAQAAPQALTPAGPMQETDIAFMRRRLEKMEKELIAAHQRTFAAEQILKHQQAVKGEVESYLKTITEQLRREKAEREAKEEKSHAQGRIDALEKRLDEVHQSLLSVIRESLARPAAAPAPAASASQAPASAVPLPPNEFGKAFLTVRGEIDRLGKEIELWRLETQKAIGKIPETLRQEKENTSKELGQIAANFNDRVSGWERIVQIELERQRERLEDGAHARSALSGSIENIKDSLAKVFQAIQDAPPKARDEIIENLEIEKQKLLDALKEKAQSLAQFMKDRTAMEQELAAKIMVLHEKLDEERRTQDSLRTRLPDLETENARAALALEAARKSLKDKEDLYAALSAQKEELQKTLLSELSKGREQAAKSRQIQEEAQRHVEDMERRISQAGERNLSQDLALSQLRNQITETSGQLTHALKEKEELRARYAAWEQEREKLLNALRDKDEMISMLNNTFKGMLGKP